MRAPAEQHFASTRHRGTDARERIGVGRVAREQSSHHRRKDRPYVLARQLRDVIRRNGRRIGEWFVVMVSEASATYRVGVTICSWCSAPNAAAVLRASASSS